MSRQAISYPTVEAVKAIHAEVLAAHGGAEGLRDASLLDSAIAAPQATMFGKPLIIEPLAVAAAYLFYLCADHPFVDGNKRTALATCLVFLSENGFLPNEDLETNSWECLVTDVAAGRLDREQTATRLREILVSR